MGKIKSQPVGGQSCPRGGCRFFGSGYLGLLNYKNASKHHRFYVVEASNRDSVTYTNLDANKASESVSEIQSTDNQRDVLEGEVLSTLETKFCFSPR